VRRTVHQTISVVAAIAVVGVAMWFLSGCGSSSSSSSTTSGAGGAASTNPEARAVAASKRFLKNYVTPDGRVVRVDQGHDTVGEGQAYGMLMAAAIGDKKRFSLIWDWTQKNLQRPDGLISFLWKNGHIVDPQAASDADLDASRALLVAGCRFHQPTYKQQALRLGSAILHVEVGSASFHGAPVLTAGPWAITPPPPTINVSYFSPASFAALRAASGDSAWSALASSSRAITSKVMPTAGRLPPDWAHVEGDNIVPIGDPGKAGAQPQFGFDAVRTLIRMAEDPNPLGREIAARAWPVFENQVPTNIGIYYNLHGQPIGHLVHPVALVGAAGAADAAGQSAARDGLLDAAEALDRHGSTYYGAAWVALGRIMLTTRLLDCT
jgi:endo-1,4-beta-D-glucanase Y